jgi:hypothetical protein
MPTDTKGVTIVLEQVTREGEFATYAAPPWIRTKLTLDATALTIDRPWRLVPGQVRTTRLDLREIALAGVGPRVAGPAAVVSLGAALFALFTLPGVLGEGGLTRFMVAVLVACVAAMWSLRASVRVVTTIDEVFDVSLALGELDDARDFVDALGYAVGLAEARDLHGAGQVNRP